MSIASKLFPPANREASGVAFIRTAWQTARATAFLSVAGGVVVTANDLATVSWVTVGLTAAGVAVTSAIAGVLAAGDILVHGLPAAYQPTVAPAEPAA